MDAGKFQVLVACVATFSVVAIGEETYRFEVVVREGDLLDGARLVDLDTDDGAPVINNYGETAFYAVTDVGEAIHFRSSEGDVRRIVGYGDRLPREPPDGLGMLIRDFSEEGSYLQIGDDGTVYHSDFDDLDYVGVDDIMLYSFPEESLPGFVTAAAPLTTAFFDRLGNSYLHGFMRESGVVTMLKNGEVFRESGMVDGVEIIDFVANASPMGRVGMTAARAENRGDNGNFNDVFFEKQQIYAAGDEIDGKASETFWLVDVNDSGQLMYLVAYPGRDPGTEYRIDGRRLLQHRQMIGDFEVGVPNSGSITADGNGVFQIGLCENSCQVKPVASYPSVVFNDQIIFKPGDVIADEAELIGFQRWSANDRGDVVFLGRFDDGIDRIVIAERMIEPFAGDVNNDNALDLSDIYLLSESIRKNEFAPEFDLVTDGVLDDADLQHWVREIKGTYFGDADLNGEFNSSDLVRLFETGEYEDGVPMNSIWLDGDFNGDGEFGTTDLVLAFQDGGYEKGPRQAIATVPEPNSLSLIAMMLLGAISKIHFRR